MKAVRQHGDGVDRERMSQPRIPERRAQRFDMFGEQPLLAFGQTHREEITPARDKVVAIVHHRLTASW